MDYYTTAKQENELEEKYRLRCEREQDRLRGSLYRFRSQPVKEDRIFFVEDGKVYLGEVHPDCECPMHPVLGGKTYGIDFMFVREVEEFLKRNTKYVVTFEMRNEYSHRAGIYPARMTSMDEELILDESAV